MELKQLSMSNFANGAAQELFDREMKKAVENIGDINTDPKAVREVSLTFRIKPDQNRETAALSVSAKSKIAPVNAASGQAYFGRNKKTGELIAYGQNINQLELDVDTKLEAVKKEDENVG